MFPVAAIAGAGWLLLFVVLLIVPPSPGPHEGGGQGEGRTARTGRTRMPHPGEVPPAVVSLLARRLERSGFGATLVDLAARGWVRGACSRRACRAWRTSIHGSVHIAAEASL